MPVEEGDALASIAERWLVAFEAAITQFDDEAITALFCEECHWRDVLSFTWHIKTFSGAVAIVEGLKGYCPSTNASGFKLDQRRTLPRRLTRVGTEVIEAFFLFRTTSGPANGVVRLIPTGKNNLLKAWTLMTALDEIEGFEETIGDARPTGEAYSRNFAGLNWLDRRESASAYINHDPDVLVVGGGHAGLSIAARLTQLKVDTLVVDRESRIGDNWRNRYHALTLHNQVHVNHLPYMPFPPNWPTYIPKDKLAGWFEAYAESMELNFWTNTEFVGGTYDLDTKCWSAQLRRPNGNVRELHPRHVIMATSVSSVPNLPKIPHLEEFDGTVLHSSEYGCGADWVGKKVLIIGAGNSGHDIAQDLYSHNASVTLAQRGPTLIVGIEPSAQLPYAMYKEGPPLEDNDLLTISFPFQMLKKFHQRITEQTKIHDNELLKGLTRRGFKLDFGIEDTGWQFKYLERGGGYYFNVGCSDLIVDGKIGLVQFADIDRFTGKGPRMRNGDTLPVDLIVLATGYKGQEYMVRELFGNEIAERVGPIWGYDPNQQELRNMWVRTGQPGLWFIAGSFAQCRIYSKYLAIQVKACKEGLIPL